LSGLSRVDQELATQPTGSIETDSVLVAEDDPLFRRILESWLGKWEYRVTAAEDGLKAWQVLENGNAPQLLILDWIMPGIDGIELCRRIRSRKQLRYPYILLLTARDDNRQEIEKALENVPCPEKTPVPPTGWSPKDTLERMEGDEKLFLEILAIFLDESPKLIAQMERGLGEQKPELLQRAAHSLRGDLGYLGAPEISQTAHQTRCGERSECRSR